nr:MAG: hypothetical protein [Bacteriophage sp.]
MSNGTIVGYLKSDDWTKYENNTNVDFNADLFCQEGGASSTTYFCDHYWTNAVDSNRALLMGAHSDGGSSAGLFYLASNYGTDTTVGNAGTRLVYIP